MNEEGIDKVIEQVKAAKPDDLRSIPRIHMEEGKNHSQQLALDFQQLCYGICTG